MSAMSPSPTRRELLAAMAAAGAIEVTESEAPERRLFGLSHADRCSCRHKPAIRKMAF